ncbi:DgyrCDS2916 [Dimorphilus gyrociliatus]|nr:DgyrCDS2916 [Dimorphilus gyrociliatus]
MAHHGLADRLQGTDQNVWVEFGNLVVKEKALNLGQGFPDFHAPEYVKKALAEAVMSDNPFLNQYTRGYGHPRLVKALADLYSPLMNHPIDPMNEILISVGAYGGLFCAVQGLINPGDEVIIIEPFFDCYEPMVRVAGGVPVFVPLRRIEKPEDAERASFQSSEFCLDYEELSSKFSHKTKAIFFNNPNNPLGKVYSMEECEMIADLCKKYNTIVFSDEVYEWLIYDDKKHIKIANLPGMYDQTLTFSSAGKAFSVTGWKLGWTIGPPHLVKACSVLHQNCSYTCPTPLQEAIAMAVEREIPKLGSGCKDCYLLKLARELQPKRDFLAKCLQEVGMKPIIPDGGYFMIADYSGLMNASPEINLGDSNEPKDYQFVKWMIANKVFLIR